MDRAASASRRSATADRLVLPLSAPATVPRGYYYAAAADHFAVAASHFAVAARYLSTAFRVPRRVSSAPGEASSHGGDLDSELGLPSAPSAPSSSTPSAASSSPSILPASSSDAGTDGDEDDIAERLYELLYVAIAATPPYPLYKLLPEDVVCGAAPAWTWFLIFYGVAFAVLVTVVSARVFRSSCCTSTCLRTLLFVASVGAEVAVGINITPPTTLARSGTIFTVICLSVLYLLAWIQWERRRLG